MPALPNVPTLVEGESRRVGHREVVCQQVPIRTAHRNGQRIRERSIDKDAVKQAGERVADTFARNGSA